MSGLIERATELATELANKPAPASRRGETNKVIDGIDQQLRDLHRARAQLVDTIRLADNRRTARPNVDQLNTAMGKVDVELHAAEVAGDTALRIRLLHRRAALWRDYHRLLELDGKVGSGAELAALRAEHTARPLAAEGDQVE